MVESKAKKAAFLRETVRALGLADVAVESARFEAIGGACRVELVTVRAVRGDALLAEAVRRMLKPLGVLAAFGRGTAEIGGFSAQTVVPLSSGTATVTLLRGVPRGTTGG